jgi:hypothetical protein
LESSVSDDLDDRICEFRDYATSTIGSRALAEKCRDYKNGDQLSEEERRALKKRKQPPVIDNKIQDKCDTLIGIEQQTRTDPKAYPRTPKHDKDAEAATDALRYIKDDSRFTEVTTAAYDNLVVEGLCAGEVIIEKRDNKYPKIKMNRIRWDRLFYDPHSLELDYSDARYKGFFTWMDVAEAEGLWPEKKEELEKCFAAESVSSYSSHEDIPRFSMISGKRKRVQVFTTYYRKSEKWMRAVWCIGGYLEGPETSNYKDEDGKPDCCIELQAVYKDRDGNPFGSAPRWIDLQDAHNKRHSKMLHLLNTKQMHVEKGAFEDINKARSELHKPDGVIEYTPGMKSEIVTNLDMAQGQFQLLQYTDAQLSATGPNAALMGQSGDISGKAKQLDQQAGSLTTAPLSNAHRSWKLRMYRHAWNRVRQYWTGEMWIRVTDDEDNVRFVGLNQPVLQGDLLAEQLKNDPRPPEEKAALLQQVAQDPAMQQPVMDGGKPKLKNNVAEMDVDIIIDEAPDTITVQSEEFVQLVELAKSGAVQIPPKALITASQLRSQTKKLILDQMSGENDPAAQAMAALQQKMLELEAMLKEGQVAKLAAETNKANAAAGETEIDTAVKLATFTSGADAGAEAGSPGKPASKTQVSVN